ncbi:MAG: xanthine dehydrogenase family protein subunit M [Phycisphaerales bacterium]|nr:MAG: xanthine dehydrogenase family protein subunit M [Phycisphaerales bacterium]
MHLPYMELHEAATLQEAVTAKRRYAPDARLLAGGTDLLVDLKAGRVTAGHLVSVNRIDALRGVSETDGGLRIGALTTITQLGRSPIVRERFSPILDATGKMAAPQIRNVATVGGNIACAVPCADLPPILTAMHASVALWSPKGERSVPLEAFFVDARQTVLRDDEVLTRVLMPKPRPGFGAAYARFALRNGNAIAVAAVAAGLTLGRDNTVRNARIVLGAVAPIPKMVEAARTVLVGRRPEEEAFRAAALLAVEAAEPISDVRGSADFRREVVGVMTRRALATACRRARENAA